MARPDRAALPHRGAAVGPGTRGHPAPADIPRPQGLRRAQAARRAQAPGASAGPGCPRAPTGTGHCRQQGRAAQHAAGAGGRPRPGGHGPNSAGHDGTGHGRHRTRRHRTRPPQGRAAKDAAAAGRVTAEQGDFGTRGRRSGTEQTTSPVFHPASSGVAHCCTVTEDRPCPHAASVAQAVGESRPGVQDRGATAAERRGAARGDAPRGGVRRVRTARGGGAAEGRDDADLPAGRRRGPGPGDPAARLQGGGQVRRAAPARLAADHHAAGRDQPAPAQKTAPAGPGGRPGAPDGGLRGHGAVAGVPGGRRPVRRGRGRGDGRPAARAPAGLTARRHRRPVLRGDRPAAGRTGGDRDEQTAPGAQADPRAPGGRRARTGAGGR